MQALKDKKYLTPLLHLIFWAGYLALLLFVFANRIPVDKALPRVILFMAPQMVLAYINMEWLVPKFFFSRRYLEYFLILLALLALLYLTIEYLGDQFLTKKEFVKELGRRPHMRDMPRDARMMTKMMRGLMNLNFLLTLAIVFLSTAYKVSQFASVKEKEAAQLRSANLDAELKFLKSQINPHFLFNALNNVYALSVLKSDKTPAMILKLSEILRYLLYDCTEEKVPLQKEIAYLKNYIELQQLKDDQLGHITVNMDVADTQIKIEPMLLTPFVENSFKHSKIEDQENGWIKMELKMLPGSRLLQFSIANSKPATVHSKDQVGGIGLENVKRRLELLYPDHHELIIQQNEKEFAVHLNILL